RGQAKLWRPRALAEEHFPQEMTTRVGEPPERSALKPHVAWRLRVRSDAMQEHRLSRAERGGRQCRHVSFARPGDANTLDRLCTAASGAQLGVRRGSRRGSQVCRLESHARSRLAERAPRDVPRYPMAQ